MQCRILLLPLALLCLVGRADAGPIITVDENGTGFVQNGATVTPLPVALKQDPGPGGLPGVLTYKLPFAGTQGDVGLFGPPGPPNGEFSDVVRFNGDGTLIFYSDTPPFDSIADTPTPPLAFYQNTAIALEIGPEGNNGAFYTPLSGQPGFDPSGPTYHFVSDGSAVPIPEPASLALFGLGGAALAGWGAWRRRRQAAA
jgi:hypothetical protein